MKMGSYNNRDGWLDSPRVVTPSGWRAARTACAAAAPRAGAQAVPRHQEETWKQSLDNVSTWVRAYYDTDDATTKAFLDEVDKLSQQSITMTVPETLQSQALLEKLMQTRVRNLMAQPAVSAGGAPAPAPSAPAAPAAPAAPQGE